MKVARLDAWTIDAPLKKPFGIAGGAQEVASNVIVRVALDDGATGHGEGAPFPAFNGETQEATLAAVEQAKSAVVGADTERVDALVSESRSGAARCAIEMAVLDAVARSRGVPIFPHRGGSLVTDVTIPIGAIDECADDARAWAALGFGRLKVKIGGAGLDEALARIVAVHEAAPRAELLLDGNAGLSVADALALVRALAERGIEPALFEQPCARGDIEGLCEVARVTGIRVAADESASSLRDVERLAKLAPLVVNVKPMKYGFAEARAIAAFAHERRMPLMIGGMVEGKMAMSASACFAAALGCFDYVDLDTPLFFAEDPFEGGYAQDGERMDLTPIAKGHGVVPRSRPAESTLLSVADQ